ncbi:MAG TPA: hypothetical protein VGR25_03815 [bacterium]|jgi:hypothetical protein|nr:hypothetical protein [bacterium]
MIIWNGRGWIVAVTTFVCLLLVELAVENLYRDDQFYQSHGWPKLAGFALAAIVVFFADRLLFRTRSQGMGTPQPNGPVAVREPDKLFFIDVKYWPYVLVGLGVAFLLL